jgi:hypothetical protein
MTMSLFIVHRRATMNGNEFEQQLYQLVAKAHENDVSVRGSYDLQTGEANRRNLQLQITEVASNGRSQLLSGK